MQKEDRPGPTIRDAAIHDRVDPRTVRVPDAQRPADGSLSQVARDRSDPRAAKPVRRPEHGGSHTGRLLDDVRAELEVHPHVRGTAEVQLAMVVAVIAEQVSLGGRSSRQIPPTFDVLSPKG